MIVFDLMFSILNIPESEEEETVKALKSLKDINATIVTGAFSSPVKQRLRPAVSPLAKDFQLKSYFKLPNNRENLKLKILNHQLIIKVINIF